MATLGNTIELEHGDTHAMEGLWKKVWHLKLPPKWALFLWKLLHRILPVKTILLSRGIHVNRLCPRCFGAEETLEHLCFQCPFAKHIWRGSNFDEGEEELSVADWLKPWFDQAPEEGFILESVEVLWGIWLHRNKAAYDSVVEDPSHTITFINQLDWTSRDLSEGINQPRNLARQIIKNSSCNCSYVVTNNLDWCPDLCFDSILVDGAWSEQTRKAGAAWVAIKHEYFK